MLGNKLINRYITAISDIGSSNFSYEEISPFALPITIDLTKSKHSETSLYDFQKIAIDKLKDDLLVKVNNSGMLVMPTGERVIIVMGAINALESRVSGTLNKYISCIA